MSKSHNIQYWLDVISTQGRNLTKWEQDFIDQMMDAKYISEKQAEIIERIYAEKTP